MCEEVGERERVSMEEVRMGDKKKRRERERRIELDTCRVNYSPDISKSLS